MEFTVDPIWPWSFIALAILGLLALVLTTYPSRIRHLPTIYRRLLLGLRLAAVAALSLAMLRPAVQFSETDRQSAVLAVLMDASRSMNTQDGPGGTTRRQALLKTLADSDPHFEAIREEVDIRFFDFAEALTPVDEAEDEAGGQQTALGAVLENLLRETDSQRLAGVLLLSDGAHRALPPFDADPRQTARRFGELQIPVHTIGFGGSGLSETSLDLAVEDLLVDPLVFEKKLVPVNVRVRALGAAGRTFTVRLLVEDRTGKRPGESGELKVPPTSRNAQPVVQLQTNQNADLVPVELSYVPDQPGEFKLAVEVVPLDDELKQSNNRLETIITVQKGGINIAYFDKLRPEQKFLRMVNTAENIQLDYVPIRSGRIGNPMEIDAEFFEPGRYDAYIIGDVSAEMFGPAVLDQLAARVEEGAGLLMTGGYHSFGPGGYAQTPLSDLLPVETRPHEQQTGDEIATDLHHLQPLQMIPTGRGLQHFIMRIDSADRNRETWAQLAPLEGANKLAAKDGLVELLAETPDGIPLLFAQEVGQARVVAFAADTTYQWVLAGQGEAHQQFWRQMILWLARKEMDTDQPVWVRVDPRNFAPQQRVEINFGARNEDGSPIPEARFEVDIMQPNGESQQPTPQRDGNRHRADFVQTESAGDYWVRVAAENESGEMIGFDAWTRFIVDSRDLELDNPAADLALLNEISSLTGGVTLRPEQLPGYLDNLLKQGSIIDEMTTIHRVTLWDNWPFLILFVVIMSAEWFFRKRRGLV